MRKEVRQMEARESSLIYPLGLMGLPTTFALLAWSSPGNGYGSISTTGNRGGVPVRLRALDPSERATAPGPETGAAPTTEAPPGAMPGQESVHTRGIDDGCPVLPGTDPPRIGPGDDGGSRPGENAPAAPGQSGTDEAPAGSPGEGSPTKPRTPRASPRSSSPLTPLLRPPTPPRARFV
jgi:hypothetical protein